MMRHLFQHRYGLILLMILMSVGVFFITRTALLGSVFYQLDAHGLDILNIYGIGFLYDLGVLSYLLIPFVVYLTFLSNRAYHHRYHKLFVYLLLFVLYYSLLLAAVAEGLFWQEFGARFNFISVDYLIYRREVTGNIYESYPIISILAGIALTTALLLFIGRHAIQLALRPTLYTKSTWQTRFTGLGAFCLLPIATYFGLSQNEREISQNNYQNELASNGIYQFVHAFRNNQLDYNQFYLQKEASAVQQALKQQIAPSPTKFLNQTPFDLARDIDNPGKEKHLNVFLIVVESLSAEYLGVFGNKEQLTPYLDVLADQSLFFTNFYATGTRTIRGLEAVTLSIPPTPGQSIVKRPHNQNLFSLGFVFKDKGYDTKFIYGGYGYFDNMNAFFEHNGFTVLDRTQLTQPEIEFENIWGVADESLFNRALREANRSYQQQKPFFSLIMTTSNHRPYTYPEGRIKIPSGTGREGGVQYTDYAIATFLEAAKQQLWFKDTLFVIVADHCASSAGKEDLPIQKYHIPLYIYAPDHIKPQKITTLSSQMDVAPTLLALLNFDYTSRFFGRNILTLPKTEERALISNYQKLGLYKQNALVILSPQQKVEVIFDPLGQAVSRRPTENDPLLMAALGYYQGAYYIYTQGLYQRIQNTKR